MRNRTVFLVLMCAEMPAKVALPSHERLVHASLRVPGRRAGLNLRAPFWVRRWARTRFPEDQPLPVGRWVRVLNRRGRRRPDRILEVRGKTVVVNTNHRRAGQALNLGVELVGIQPPDAAPDVREPCLRRPAGVPRREGTRQPTPDRGSGEEPMQDRRKAIAFDVDPDSLTSLRQAFPDWEVEATDGASPASLERERSPGAADLLVVGGRGRRAGVLGLCRGLRSQAGRAHTPLLVLVPPGQEALVRAALDAGATSCLVLPVHAKELVSMVDRAREGNRPGRHTLSLDPAQKEDAWRDDGGEA